MNKAVQLSVSCLLIGICLAKPVPVLAQRADSVQAKRLQMLSKRLSIDGKKAVEVTAIDDKYRKLAEIVMRDTSISQKTKRQKMNQLISQRAAELGTILSPGELAGAMPPVKTTMPVIANADSVRHHRVRELSRQLSITDQKAALVLAVNDSYKQSVKAVMDEKSLPAQARRDKIDGLISQKNAQLSAMLAPAQLDKLLPTTERKRMFPEMLIR